MLLNAVVITMIALFFMSFCAVESVDNNFEAIFADGFILIGLCGVDSFFVLVVTGALFEVDMLLFIFLLVTMSAVIVVFHWLLLTLLTGVVEEDKEDASIEAEISYTLYLDKISAMKKAEADNYYAEREKTFDKVISCLKKAQKVIEEGCVEAFYNKIYIHQEYEDDDNVYYHLSYTETERSCEENHNYNDYDDDDYEDYIWGMAVCLDQALHDGDFYFSMSCFGDTEVINEYRRVCGEEPYFPVF